MVIHISSIVSISEVSDGHSSFVVTDDMPHGY